MADIATSKLPQGIRIASDSTVNALQYSFDIREQIMANVRLLWRTQTTDDYFQPYPLPEMELATFVDVHDAAKVKAAVMYRYTDGQDVPVGHKVRRQYLFIETDPVSSVQEAIHGLMQLTMLAIQQYAADISANAAHTSYKEIGNGRMLKTTGNIDWARILGDGLGD